MSEPIDYEAIILKIVNRNTGIKAVELAMKVMEEINPQRFSAGEYHAKLDGLVYIKKIMEVEIILPDGLDRIKSIYFPKGTQITINRNVSEV